MKEHIVDTNTGKLIKQLRRAAKAAIAAKRPSLAVRLLEDAVRIAGLTARV